MITSRISRLPVVSPAEWLRERLDRASAAGIFTEEIELTPALAEHLLTINDANRLISAETLQKYEADVADGKWEINGETLKVSSDGFLNDGQHRCHAVINQGRSIRTYITFGLTRESRFTLDQGRSRRAGDYLAMQGVHEPLITAAVAAMIWQWEKRGTVSHQHQHRPTKQQIREAALVYGDKIAESAGMIPRKGSANAGGLSVLAFCHCVFAEISRVDADVFIRKLIFGDGLGLGDPIYVARERLRSNKRLRLGEKVELIFRAWNAFRERRTVRTLPITGALPNIG